MSDSENQCGWGIVGVGPAARAFVGDLGRVPGARLAAVASRSAARAEAFASAFGVATAHEGVDPLLADAAVDVVYLATPPAAHAGQALAAIAAGKPVLVEKPFAVTAEEAERVASAAREAGVFCMEAMWTRFLPGYRRALELVRQGAIGEPRSLVADFGIPVDAEPGSRYLDPAQGGGALLDRGVYPLGLALHLWGEPEQVSGAGRRADTGVDDHVAAALKFAGGQTAAVTCSLSAYGSNAAVIAGSTGRLTIGEPLCRPEVLTITTAPRISPATGPSPIAKPGLKAGVVAAIKGQKHLKALLRAVPGVGRDRVERFGGPGHGYQHEAAHVQACLAAGAAESDVMPLADSLALMRTVDRVRAAVFS